jgi:hypothetical protein
MVSFLLLNLSQQLQILVLELCLRIFKSLTLFVCRFHLRKNLKTIL